MRTLFLSSFFSGVKKLFKETVGEACEGKSVTFIPTASKPEKMDFFVGAAKKVFAKLGIRVDELDVSIAGSDEMLDKLRNNDYIYVSGGNTFYLLQELKKSGADRVIIDQIDAGKLYIGESAGSIILAPNIEYVQGVDDRNAAPELKDCGALGVIDFYPLPHQGNFPFKKAVEKTIARYGKELNLTPFNNSQAIVVRGEEVQILSK